MTFCSCSSTRGLLLRSRALKRAFLGTHISLRLTEPKAASIFCCKYEISFLCFFFKTDLNLDDQMQLEQTFGKSRRSKKVKIKITRLNKKQTNLDEFLATDW